MIIKPNEMNFENEKFNVLIAGYPGWGVDKETFGENSREAVRERIYKALTGKDGLTEEEIKTAPYRK